MDKSRIIEKYIFALGNECVITDNENEMKTKCILTPLWKQNKTFFEPKNTQIGLTRDDYYKVIIPKSCDISELDEKSTLRVNGKEYYFVKHEPVYVSGVLHYHFCIAKEIYKGDDYVFE